MAKAKNVPYFPTGIELRENCIYDYKTGAEVPINPVAKVMLEHIDGNTTVGNIVDKLLTMFKVDEETLYRDFNGLLDGLTSHYMLNWKYVSTNKLRTYIANFTGQYRKGYKERFEVKGEGFISIYLSILKVVFYKLSVFWIYIILLAGLINLVFRSSLINNIMAYCTILFAGIFIGYTLHESIHLYTYRKATGKSEMGYFAANRATIMIIRPADMDKPLIHVTLLGPLIPSIIGIAGLIIFRGNYYIQAFFATFAIHIMSLLPFWGDGKTIFQYLVLLRVKAKMEKKYRMSANSKTDKNMP